MKMKGVSILLNTSLADMFAWKENECTLQSPFLANLLILKKKNK
jgi:hypothetical protein